MERIKACLGKDWDKFLTGIRQYLSSDIDLLNSVNQNLLLNSGKQVRPLMALLVARACASHVTDDSLRYAISAELLHNATLYHDDVADKSDQRRGRPTLRAILGPEASVLVGDFWLVCALRAIMDSERGRDRCLVNFSKTLGDLAEGEMLQLQKASSCDTTEDDYYSIIFRKTASLFVAAAQSAAISVDASPQQEQAAVNYAKYIGYAFQIRDDIFDYAGDGNVGKPLGVDILEQKITLPLLCALKKVDAEAQARWREAIKKDAASARDSVIAFVRENGGVQDAQKALDMYIRKAQDELSAFGDSEEKKLLYMLADFIAIRNR